MNRDPLVRTPEKDEAPTAGTVEASGGQESKQGSILAAATPASKMQGLGALQPVTVPAPLRDLPAWLAWKFEPPPGGGKPRKVPYWTGRRARRCGVQGGATDRGNLVRFDAAQAGLRGFDGVGIAILPDWGICAVDFDNCVDEAGNVHPEVLAAIEGTYAELSPSSRGVRAFVRGHLGDRKDNDPARSFGVELFSSRGFVTVTGKVLELVALRGDEDTIGEPAPALLALIDQRFGTSAQAPAAEPSSVAEAPQLGLTPEQIRRALSVLPKDLGYDEWVKVGMAVHHETAGAGFELWDDWSSTSPKYTSSEYGRARWDSFGRGGQRPVTAHHLVKLANEKGAEIDLLAGAADDFDVVAAPAPAAAKASRFRPMQPSELLARPPMAWLVKGLLPRAEVGTLFGPPGCGKSFVMLDLCAAIARGLPWRGLKANRGRVVYVIGEGVRGFGQRLQAYALRAGMDSPDEIGVEIVTAAPNLLKANAADARELAAQVGLAHLIVIDTLARATPGANENAGEDMGRALDQCKTIHEATGAMVVLVHHTGKDASKGARGWSGIKGAMDVEIEVSRDKAGNGRIELTKSKDSADGLEWGFRLDVVPLGFDQDGDQVSSCVVVVASAAPQRVAVFKPHGAWEAAVWSVVLDAVGPIVADDLIAAAVQAMPKPEEGKDRRREYVQRALRGLIEKGVMVQTGDYFAVPQEAA